MARSDSGSDTLKRIKAANRHYAEAGKNATLVRDYLAGSAIYLKGMEPGQGGVNDAVRSIIDDALSLGPIDPCSVPESGSDTQRRMNAVLRTLKTVLKQSDGGSRPEALAALAGSFEKYVGSIPFTESEFDRSEANKGELDLDSNPGKPFVEFGRTKADGAWHDMSPSDF